MLGFPSCEMTREEKREYRHLGPRKFCAILASCPWTSKTGTRSRSKFNRCRFILFHVNVKTSSLRSSFLSSFLSSFSFYNSRNTRFVIFMHFRALSIAFVITSSAADGRFSIVIVVIQCRNDVRDHHYD
jgi:hypothetical protein